MTAPQPVATERFAATPDDIPRATAWADAVAAQAGADDEMRYAIQVCVEELASNSVRHGRRDFDAGGAQWFELSVAAVDSGIVLAFSDDAAPFDITKAEAHKIDRPLDEVEIGGLGIGLIRSMSHTIAWEWRDGANLTTLSFVPKP